jgi:16S rRNA (adenine1518-N6/adenine1519-N6)-dimethyltransferase
MELRAKKSLGQHFLNSPSALSRIVVAANIIPGETVLEIGPGTGILTRALIEAGAYVVAVEKDHRSCDLLSEKFKVDLSSGKLKLHRGDILEANRADLGLADGGYALVANIPYYITGMILQQFLEFSPRPNRLVLLVQKEVATRIAAKDGKESILSVSVKAFGDPKIIATVPRGAFVPPPNVDSAIIAVENVSAKRFGDDATVIKRFFEVVKAGFAHKRKLTRRNIEALLEPDTISEIWKSLELDQNARPEDLDIAIWENIASWSKTTK